MLASHIRYVLRDIALPIKTHIGPCQVMPAIAASSLHEFAHRGSDWRWPIYHHIRRHDSHCGLNLRSVNRNVSD